MDDTDNPLRILPLDVERRLVEKGSHKGKGIAVFTSGGDSQGMNAAVRAVVRFGIYLGCKVFFIKEGYQGMVDGDTNIVEAEWSSVSGIIHKGGTVIGSARCQDFREKEGRLKAAKNLIDRGISNLVCIGGDGSLTGANLFRAQWSRLVQELVDTARITPEAGKEHGHLNIVGMVGSIDNDFCGTDMTIGTDSALHRIVESVDAIKSTASSHQRTFIMEVMGRHCGYLALVAGIVNEADYVFIPEWPPERNWREKMCRKLETERDSGKRLNIIIVSEGAIDQDGTPITAEAVKRVIVEKLKQDTRITVLGHVQRGGAPSAFDRILGCRMGAESVLALMDAKPDTEACVVSISRNAVVRVPLMACVEKTQAVAKAMNERNWELAVKLRGSSFESNLNVFREISRIGPPDGIKPNGKNLGVLHVGAPCCGMNAAVHSFVRHCLFSGNNPVCIHNGVKGMIEDEVEVFGWSDVANWIGEGGAFLGTNRILPETNYKAVAETLVRHNIHGLVVIGGFEAFAAVLQMTEVREKYPEFKIPMAVLPSTISNNVPGTDFSLGSDTALNEITEICDRIRQSAQGTNRRVFIVETMGGNSGYLATMAGLAGGADAAYIPEEKFGISDLVEDLNVMVNKMDKCHVLRGLILTNEKACEKYDIDFIKKLYSKEGDGVFSVRQNILGHMQQGGSPSPFDRNFGTKMGARSVDWLNRQLNEGGDAAVLMGVRKRVTKAQSVLELKEETNFKARVPREKQWWMKLRSIMRIVAKHEEVYEVEGNAKENQDDAEDIHFISQK